MNRGELRARIDAIGRDLPHSPEGRRSFFDTVYERAGDDPAMVPWADLAAKPELQAWLAENPGRGGTALDIACGLGDNAEAMAAAGWITTAFDLSEKAIDWAKTRFPGTSISYRAASLLDPPPEWRGAFDLVNECCTIQSVPPEMHERLSQAVADLVAPCGVLLVYARTRAENSAASGPPWPLMPSETGWFASAGFRLLSERQFALHRPDRSIPHLFSVWEKG